MKIQVGTKKEWSEIYDSNAKISFFSSPEWCEIVSEYSTVPYEIKKIELRGSVYILPLFTQKRRFFSIYGNTLFGTYCGLITNTEVTPFEEIDIVERVMGKRNFNYTSCPYLVKGNSLLKKEFTQIIKLPTFDISEISNNHQRSIVRAKEYSLKIQFSEEISDWEYYFKIYEQVTKERGKSATNNYRWNLFQLIFALPLSKRKLWLIKEGNNIIGGGLYFYQNQVIYWHGCNSKRSKEVGGSHLLHMTVIEHSKKLGFNIYDFSPSGGHKGVELFKAGFGAEKIYLTHIQNRSKMYKFVLKANSVRKSIVG